MLVMPQMANLLFQSHKFRTSNFSVEVGLDGSVAAERLTVLGERFFRPFYGRLGCSKLNFSTTGSDTDRSLYVQGTHVPSD